MEKRLFVAIKMDPSPEFAGFFGEIKQSLSDEQIKWVDITNFHFTLKFLGKTKASKFMKLTEILSAICTKHKPFTLNLTGTGYLGSRNHPKVLVVNVDPNETLQTVSQQIEEGLSALGFTKEERAFRAHLTLGRIKHIQDKQAFYSLLSDPERTFYQQVRVKKIILFESILNSRGPVYKILQQFPLQG